MDPELLLIKKQKAEALLKQDKLKECLDILEKVLKGLKEATEERNVVFGLYAQDSRVEQAFSSGAINFEQYHLYKSRIVAAILGVFDDLIEYFGFDSLIIPQPSPVPPVHRNVSLLSRILTSIFKGLGTLLGRRPSSKKVYPPISPRIISKEEAFNRKLKRSLTEINTLLDHIVEEEHR